MTQHVTTATINDHQHKAVYGYENEIGYFIRIFDKSGKLLLVDLSSASQNLTSGRLLEVFAQHNVDVNIDHLTAIAFDLPV